MNKLGITLVSIGIVLIDCFDKFGNKINGVTCDIRENNIWFR